jgi:hypothetical protein
LSFVEKEREVLPMLRKNGDAVNAGMARGGTARSFFILAE